MPAPCSSPTDPRMGPMSQLMQMIPGMSNLMPAGDDMVPTCAHYVPLGSAGSLFFGPETGAEKEGVKRIKRFMARYLGSSRLPIRGQSAESTASIDLRSSWTACRVHRKLMCFSLFLIKAGLVLQVYPSSTVMILYCHCIVSKHLKTNSILAA